MKKYLSIIILCLGCLGILGAQNVWKPISSNSPILGAASNGDLYAMGGYSGLLRSQDEGETWQVVLGYETGFSGYFNQHCFAVSPEGRICVFNDNQQTVVYSDDNGDSWQETTILSSCAMNDVAGLCAPSNDIVVVWGSNGEMYWTMDGGTTWSFEGLELDEESQISDMIINAEGDVYVGVCSYSDGDAGIFHSTLSDIQNWDPLAAEGISIKDMAFDPEGNVVACGYNADGSSVGFQHIPGFYLFDGTTLAISDGGIVYRPHFVGNQAVLSYSTDHGEHFTEIGEHLPLVDIAPGGDAYFLIKGYDNHLYFDGGGEYWKSVQNADEIISYTPYHPIVEDGKQWNVLFSYPWNPPEPQHKYTDIYKIEGDTLVDGVSYKVMYTTRNENLTGWSVCGVIRETEDRQVLYRRDGSSYDEILYDFSMEVGDTIIMNGSGFYPDWMFVVETNEILINGEPRKQIVLEYPFGNGEREVWIEGLGSLYGIVDSGSLFLTGGSTNLLCYYEGDDLIWQNTTPGYDECYMVYPTPPTPPEPHSFAPQGAEWYFDVFNPWGTHPEYQRFFVDGDTIIQGHQCSIITQHFVDTGHEGGEFVYEEDNKVYWFNPTTNAFSILYDFDAEAGESWNYEVGECSHQVTVDSVGSVTWNGHTYRTQWVRFNEDVQYYSGKIIDGIGYEKGLFPSIYVCDGLEVFDASEIEYLRCYVNDGELLYHEGDYDCDYEPGTVTNQFFPLGTEWYYKIKHVNGAVTYQHLEYTADTAVNSKRVKIITETNTMYDKSTWTDYEYIYEDGDRIYWWNKDLEDFTLLYDFGAEAGDEWEINGGWYTITVHVDGVEDMTLQGKTYRVLHVTDPIYQLFTGDIICGIGHQKSFFPEGPMVKDYGYVVDGLRCYWQDGELVLTMDGEDCDAVYYELHGMDENDNASFTIYPNPTDGIITVESQSNASLQEYRITNVLGQTVQMGDLTGRQIDIRNLTQGMYFITIGKKTQKIIVK